MIYNWECFSNFEDNAVETDWNKLKGRKVTRNVEHTFSTLAKDNKLNLYVLQVITE